MLAISSGLPFGMRIEYFPDSGNYAPYLDMHFNSPVLTLVVVIS